MSEAHPLQEHIDLWHHVVAENVALLRELELDDWERPTDLPGWNVRCVAAHMAHLESDLAGNPQTRVDVPEAPHITSPMSIFTESGVLARTDWSTDQIIDEFETSAAKRHETLTAMMPLDPASPGDGFARVVGWTWETLLSNRVFDLWMHQQDIRRAVNRPGGLAGPSGAHALRHLGRSLPFVVGKKAAAPPGTSVVLEITGEHPATLAAAVGEDGRASSISPPDDPTVRITVDFETYMVLAAGRRNPDQVTTSVAGDTELAAAVLANLAVTP